MKSPKTVEEAIRDLRHNRVLKEAGLYDTHADSILMGEELMLDLLERLVPQRSDA